MKKYISFLLMLIFSSGLISTKVVARFNEVYKDPQLLIDEKQLYIFDYATSQMDIFSLNGFKKIASFGRIGEGPGEFKMNPTVLVCEDHIFASSTGKVMYFRKSGEFIKENKVPPTLLSIMPIGNRIAGFRFSISDAPPQPGTIENVFCMYFHKKEIMTPVYTSIDKVYVQRANAPKQDRYIIRNIVIPRSDGDNLIVGDANKGLYFCFIDERGEIIKELNIPYRKRKITTSDQKRLLEDYKAENEKRWDIMQQAFNFVFPDYYPPFKSFKVDGERIYVLTHLIENQKQECLVFDYDGNFINRKMVPHIFYNAFHRGRMYYLVDNQNTEAWELHVEEIE